MSVFPAHDGEVLVRHPVLVIGVPCFNEERFIEAALESLRRQTWSDFAVLISDNGSSDRTEQIARDFAARDPRFHYHRQAGNIGSAANFNFTRQATDSPYLMWHGAHDLVAPTYLAENLGALLADPGLSLSSAYSAWIDESGDVQKITRGWMNRYKHFPLLRYVMAPRTNDWCGEINNVIRRDALDGIAFSEVGAIDIVILAHLAYRGRVHYVPEPLFLRRVIQRRSDDYMKRLTGKAGIPESYGPYIDVIADHLRVVAPRHPLRPLAAWLMRAWLRRRHGIKAERAAAAIK